MAMYLDLLLFHTSFFHSLQVMPTHLLVTFQRIDDIISEAAVREAIDFTQLSCQQTAYIAGQGMLEEEVQKFDSSSY